MNRVKLDLAVRDTQPQISMCKEYLYIHINVLMRPVHSWHFRYYIFTAFSIFCFINKNIEFVFCYLFCILDVVEELHRVAFRFVAIVLKYNCTVNTCMPVYIVSEQFIAS